MMENKQSFAGTGRVFRFTLQQMLKNKGNLFALILIVVMASAAPLLSGLVSGGSTSSVLTPAQSAVFSAEMTVSSVNASNYAEEATGASFDTRYFLQYFYAIVLMVVALMSVSYIMHAIVEEKSSKLVEFLMVSIRPLGLLTGKIFASLTFVAGMLLLSGIGFGISSLVSGAQMSGFMSSLTMMTPGVLMLAIVSIIVGLFFYAILAGLCGAGCSNAEDMNAAMTAPMICALGGYMVSIIVASADSYIVSVVCSLLPVLSSFCAPVQYALGTIGLPIVILSWVIQLVVTFFMAKLSAKIYADLLVYRGKRLKLMQIIKMGGTRKGAKA